MANPHIVGVAGLAVLAFAAGRMRTEPLVPVPNAHVPAAVVSQTVPPDRHTHPLRAETTKQKNASPDCAKPVKSAPQTPG